MLARNDGQRVFSVHSAISFGVNEAILLGFFRSELNATRQRRTDALGLRGRNAPDGFELLPSSLPEGAMRRAGFELVVEAGQAWMPWTLDDLARELPFWSKAQIRRTIASCKQQGLIETGNYDQNPWDRRLWYTVKEMSSDDPG